jgi:hypothetical protein
VFITHYVATLNETYVIKSTQEAFPLQEVSTETEAARKLSNDRLSFSLISETLGRRVGELG